MNALSAGGVKGGPGPINHRLQHPKLGKSFAHTQQTIHILFRSAVHFLVTAAILHNQSIPIFCVLDGKIFEKKTYYLLIM